MQGGAALAFVAGAPRRLAVDGHDLGAGFLVGFDPQALNPGHEAVAEGLVVEGVEQIVQRIMAGNARRVGQEAAQKGQVHLAPAGDLDEAVGTAQHAAENDKHDLVQGEQNLARLPRILQPRKVVKQRNALCLLAHGRLLARGGLP